MRFEDASAIVTLDNRLAEAAEREGFELAIDPETV